jgi:two-component system sensor histidine kinase UhpB
MEKTVHSEPNLGQNVERESSWHDLAVVVLVTIVSAALSVYFELSEAIVAWTRPWERLQLDEVPVVLLVLSAALAWFARRRYREARVELRRRQTVEAQLASLLLDHRRLGQQLLRVQESERKTLAQELHDELGQYLNAIKIEAVTLEKKTPDNSSAIHEVASSIIRHTDHVYAVVRDLIRKLRPVGLDDLGLKAALEHHSNDWRQRLPNVQISISLEGDLDSIGEPLSLVLYRLVQEGMTNVAKHARAQNVGIRVLRSSAGPQARDEVTFHMVDDGTGADLRERQSGLGLIGMRERVEMLGGQLEVTAQPARGFNIIARIPVGERVAETTR